MAPFSLFYLIMWVGIAAIQSTIFQKIGKSLRSLPGTWNRATGLQQQSPEPGSWKSQKYLVSWKVSFSNVPEDEWLWAEMYFSAKYREKQTSQCRIAGDTLYGRNAQMWQLTEVARQLQSSKSGIGGLHDTGTTAWEPPATEVMVGKPADTPLAGREQKAFDIFFHSKKNWSSGLWRTQSAGSLFCNLSLFRLLQTKSWSSCSPWNCPCVTVCKGVGTHQTQVLLVLLRKMLTMKREGKGNQDEAR